jgi:hypothetical protein
MRPIVNWWSLVSSFSGFVLLAALVLDWGIGGLFPRATFAIGQGLSRYKVREKVRWVIVMGFIVLLSNLN